MRCARGEGSGGWGAPPLHRRQDAAAAVRRGHVCPSRSAGTRGAIELSRAVVGRRGAHPAMSSMNWLALSASAW
eukprot:2532986-Prymnesium_polylepis.1